jgi:hypothetical protein
MKKIFLFTFLLFILSQNSLLATCNKAKDLEYSVASGLKVGEINVTIEVKNISSKKIVIKSIKYWPNKSDFFSKKIPLNLNLSPGENIKKITFVKVPNSFIKKKEGGKFTLFCRYGTYDKAEVRKKFINWSIFIISLILLVWYLFHADKKKREKELLDYNKKNKTNFKTYDQYMDHYVKLRDLAEEKKRKADEAIRLKEKKKQEAEERLREKQEAEEQRKDNFKREQDVSLGNIDGKILINKIKKLKRLYKNGTLDKGEFEKAKNRLLK